MKIKKILLASMLMTLTLTSCRSADIAQHNIQKDADYFETYRKMTFINLYTDKILYTAEGRFSLRTTQDNQYQGQQEIALIFKISPDEYKMDYFSIANNVTYVIEQIENTHTNPYYWEIKFFIPLPSFE